MALPINELICVEDAGRLHIYKAFYIYHVIKNTPCTHGCSLSYDNKSKIHKNIDCADMVMRKIKPHCGNVHSGKPIWMYKAIRIYTIK